MAVLKCWQASPFSLCCREAHCPQSLSHCANKLCTPECVSSRLASGGVYSAHQPCFRLLGLCSWRTQLHHATRSLSQGLGYSSIPLIIWTGLGQRGRSDHTWTPRYLWLWPFLIKTHFSCSFCVQKAEDFLYKRHWISHFNGVLVTVPLTGLKLRNAFMIIAEIFCSHHDEKSLRYPRN